MNKKEFLTLLRMRLAGYEDIEKFLSFYQEAIDDRMEEGMSEEEAVAQLGDVDDIVREIEMELPFTALVKKRVENAQEGSDKKRKTWLIVLAILGFPLWVCLFAALAGVLIAVYAAIWSVVIAIFAVLLALGLSVLLCLALGVVMIAIGTLPTGLLSLAAALICAGVTLILLGPSILLTKWIIRGTGKLARWFKRLFVA